MTQVQTISPSRSAFPNPRNTSKSENSAVDSPVKQSRDVASVGGRLSHHKQSESQQYDRNGQETERRLTNEQHSECSDVDGLLTRERKRKKERKKLEKGRTFESSTKHQNCRLEQKMKKMKLFSGNVTFSVCDRMLFGLSTMTRNTMKD
jgi:hypothetical protein